MQQVFYIKHDKILLSNELHEMKLQKKTILFVQYLIDSWSLNNYKGSETLVKLPELKYTKINNEFVLYTDTQLNVRDFSDSTLHVKYYQNIPYLSHELLRSTFGKPSEFIMYNLFYLSFGTNTASLIKYLNHILITLTTISHTNVLDIINQRVETVHDYQLYRIFKIPTVDNNKLYNIDYVLQKDYVHINNIIPYDLQNIYTKKFGTTNKLYGQNVINFGDHFINRICVKLYQNSVLSNSIKIGNCILHNDITNYNRLIDDAYVRSVNILKKYYSDNSNNILSIQFYIDYKNLCNDFPFDDMYKKQLQINETRTIYQFVKQYIADVMVTQNIRTKLMILHTFLRLICYTVVRNAFIVFYVNETPDIKSTTKRQLYIKYNLGYFSELPSDFPTTQDIENYCKHNKLFYELLTKKYQIFKKLIMSKKFDIKTDNPLIYLTDVINNNIKMSFLLYMYSEFKFDASKKIQTFYKKTDACFSPEYIIPAIDKYDNVDKCIDDSDKFVFNDRGIDWVRSNPTELGDVYLEAFKNGEIMLTGHSGHSADILVGVAYLYGDYADDMTNFANLLKQFLLMCVAVMFSRKDHSIYEIYYSLIQFNILNGFVLWDNTKPFLNWLLDNLCDSQEYVKYLSNEFASTIKNIINVIQSSTNILHVIHKCLLLVPNNETLFILFNIMVKEEILRNLNDAEYAYYFAELNNTIKLFSNFKKSNFPNILTYDDFDTYEDQSTKCDIINKYKFQYYFYHGSSFINILIILRSYFSNFYCK